MPAGKRTKIVATIGPSSSSEEVLRALVLAGADIFRLNFSHGTHGDHQNVIHRIRHISRDLNRPLPILGDLSGPKLRIGEVKDGGVPIAENDHIIFTPDEGDGTGLRFHLNFDGLADVAEIGHDIMLDDGNLRVCVERIDNKEVVCRVVVGGLLKSRKGVNLPDTKLPIPALTEKDKKDLAFALRHGVDIIALSFVRTAEDILMCRREMELNGRVVPLLAKIEKKEALENLDAIIQAANGAMVARGDLGIEIPLEEVPTAQKRIIQSCNRFARPVITATQMLETMITARRPTRAEVTDIYNAIHDGTDCVMLSGETAAGAHPALVVEVMDTVCTEAERNLLWHKNLEWLLEKEDDQRYNTTNVICNSAVQIAEKLGVDMIIVPTQTGYSARHVSMYRPSVPVLAVSTEESAVMASILCWGVSARQMPALIEEEVARSESDALVNEIIRTAKRYGAVRAGNRVVVLGGIPLGRTRHTNYLRLVEVT